jgi:hypothetical protein
VSPRRAGAVLTATLAVLVAVPALAAAPSPFFASPSRNIGCVILGGTARCDIRQRSWHPPARPSSCPQVVDFGQGLEVARSGRARVVCAGDTSIDPRAPILAYGRSIARDGLVCASAPTGITCRSTRTGHGFFISRQRYRLF